MVAVVSADPDEGEVVDVICGEDKGEGKVGASEVTKGEGCGVGKYKGPSEVTKTGEKGEIPAGLAGGVGRIGVGCG